MPLYVSVADCGDEGEEDLIVQVDYSQRSKRETVYRKRIEHGYTGHSTLIPLSEVDGIRDELEELAEAAFRLGRSYEAELNRRRR